MYFHTHGDLKKIAACCVKPFELVEREEQSVSSKTGNVMLEDGLEDVESLFTEDLRNDRIGASYHKRAHSVSFSEMCTFTVELPTSEHWRPEVKITKKAEIKNL